MKCQVIVHVIICTIYISDNFQRPLLADFMLNGLKAEQTLSAGYNVNINFLLKHVEVRVIAL